MRYLFLFFSFFCFTDLVAQNQNAADLRKKMSRIRQSTDWNDPKAAKVANDSIKILSKQLMMVNTPKKQPGQQDQTLLEPKPGQITEENAEYRMKLWEQIWSGIRGGKEADVDLAKPLREEIVQGYKDDEDPTVKSPDFLHSMTLLTINMSMPKVQFVIDQMPAFRGIKTLVITCEKKGTAVDLGNILHNAASYPLEELFILNFGPSVSQLPAEIGSFSNLITLEIFNNNIRQLPSTVSNLAELRVLHADINPVNTILSVVSPLKKLSKLGLAKTNISETEIVKIKQMLPNCEILRK